MAGKAPAVSYYTVDTDQAGQRIDNFLVRELKGVPKSRIYRLLRRGEVRVNKGRVRPDYKLQGGDQIRVPPVRQDDPRSVPRPSSQLAAVLASRILYEDDGLLVINKPSGLAVHGGSGINAGLIESLRQLRPDEHFLELVHRLDRETSGCVMVARKRSRLRMLHTMLREGHIDKTYLALVAGRWPRRRDMVNLPLLKNQLQSGERMVRVSEEGKPSRTRFRVIECFSGATLVEATPVTGRTHQIRVHAQAAGCPLLGDDKYGDELANQRFRPFGLRRLFLHAAALRIPSPDGAGTIRVEAPLDDELENVLSALRASAPLQPEPGPAGNGQET